MPKFCARRLSHFLLAALSLGGASLSGPVRAEDAPKLNADQVEELKRAVDRVKVAAAHIEKKEYAQALPIFENEVVPVFERLLGPQHPTTQKYRERLVQLRAHVRASQGKKVDPNDPKLQKAMQLIRDAMTATLAGDFDRAIALTEQALPLTEELYGPVSAPMALALPQLAKLYDISNQFDKAGPLYERALDVTQKLLGSTHKELVPLLDAMAGHYLQRGDTSRAIDLLEQATAMARKTQPGTKELVDALLKEAMFKRGNETAEAARLIEEALPIAENLEPRDPETLAEAVRQLAQLRAFQGRPAEALFKRALQLAEESNDPSTLGLTRDAYGTWLREQGRLPEAEPLLVREAARIKQRFGAESLPVAGNEQSLGALRWATGRYDSALSSFETAVRINENVLRRALVAGTEAQKLAYMKGVNILLDDVRSVSVHAQGPLRERATRLGLLATLLWKGRTLDTISESMRSVRASASPEQRGVYENLQRIRGRLASLTLSGPTPEVPASSYAATLEKLQRQADELERRLVEMNPAFRVGTEEVNITAAQAQLPEDAALVDFAVYVHRKVSQKKGDLEPVGMHVLAYVLRHEGAPVVVDLGDAGPLPMVVNGIRKALASPKTQEVKRASHVLYEMLIRPLRAHLDGVEHLILSPDFDLNLIPFAALVDDDGKYLVESYTITYLSSGRDLIRLATRHPSRAPALVVGNPAFDASVGGSTGGRQRSGELARAKFTPLPGTAEEVAAIGGILPDARVLVQSEATENAITEAHGPVVLHVATHGFFLKGKSESRRSSRALKLDVEGPSQLMLSAPEVENPLLRSGLAMSGANLERGGDADGILTALEVSGLDLEGTELVVLSACETGVGEAEFGEGVYGLRRALVIAGSRSQVMSLWKVDDAATRDLMVAFYEGLRDGKGRGRALRDAQLQLLAKSGTAHPYFWASFIPSGDWGPMAMVEGAEPPSAQDDDSSGRADEDGGAPMVLGTSGIWVGVGGALLRTRAMGALPEREALMGSLEMTTSLLGPLPRKSGFGFTDQGWLAISYGQLRSDPIVMPGRTREESGQAWGYSMGYWAALGLRASVLSLYAGPRFTYVRREAGDLVVSGSHAPVMGRIMLPLFEGGHLTVRGWGGNLGGTGESTGGSVTLRLPFIDEPISLVGTYERGRLPLRHPAPELVTADEHLLDFTEITVLLGTSAL